MVIKSKILFIIVWNFVKKLKMKALYSVLFNHKYMFYYFIYTETVDDQNSYREFEFALLYNYEFFFDCNRLIKS